MAVASFRRSVHMLATHVAVVRGFQLGPNKSIYKNGPDRKFYYALLIAHDLIIDDPLNDVATSRARRPRRPQVHEVIQ